MASAPLTVLYADPEEDRWSEVTDALDAAEDIEALAVDGLTSAQTALEAWEVDCLVAEFDLGSGTAPELFAWAREHAPETSCLLFSAADAATDAERVFEDEAEAVAVEVLTRDGRDATDRLPNLVRSLAATAAGVGYPVPDDESDRLAAVHAYDLPDLSTVETFDRLTHLAAAYFDTAVAFIGLVKDDEEEMLACHGADWQVLAREESICAYSMLEESITVVEDVQADPRFEDNETLRRLDIRAYAGANLTTPDGEVIGELCLIDDHPRDFADADLSDLQLFADEAMEQLELRRRLSDRASA